MNFVSVTFDWEAKHSKSYTYECKNKYNEGDMLIVGDKRDMSVVKVISMVDEPSFKCKTILGKLEAEV